MTPPEIDLPDDRPLRMLSPLNDGVLRPISLLGTEQLSHPFSFSIEAVAPRDRAAEVDFSKLLGKAACLEFMAQRNGRSETTRYLHGIFVQVAETRRTERWIGFELTLAPKFKLMDLNSHCRVFQDQTVEQILQTVLDGYHRSFFEDFAISFRGSQNAPNPLPTQACATRSQADDCASSCQ